MVLICRISLRIFHYNLNTIRFFDPLGVSKHIQVKMFSYNCFGPASFISIISEPRSFQDSPNIICRVCPARIAIRYDNCISLPINRRRIITPLYLFYYYSLLFKILNQFYKKWRWFTLIRKNEQVMYSSCKRNVKQSSFCLN